MSPVMIRAGRPDAARFDNFRTLASESPGYRVYHGIELHGARSTKHGVFIYGDVPFLIMDRLAAG